MISKKKKSEVNKNQEGKKMYHVFSIEASFVVQIRCENSNIYLRFLFAQVEG